MAQEEHKTISRKEVTMTVPVLKVPKPFQGFVDFVREQGVVGLAIGLVLGTAVKELVDALVIAFVDPLVGIVVPNADNLANASFWFRGSEFKWGVFVSVLIRFIAIAGVIYYTVHLLKLNRIDKKKDS